MPGMSAADPYQVAAALLWARVLGLETVGLHDDFTDLGGDAATAQELVATLCDEFGVRLPSSVVAQAPTPAAFAEVWAARQSESVGHPTVMPLTPDGSGTPLFCFPEAGGPAIGLLPFARYFAGERRVYGMQAHALERRGVPDWSVSAAARRHVGEIRLLQPTGPYLLAGHSFGGLIAFEAAQVLRKAGHEVGLLALIDTYLPGTSRLTRSGAIVPTSQLEGAHPDSPTPPDAGRGIGPLAADDGPTLTPRVVVDRLRQLVELPLAGVVRFRGMHQYDVFYNQGRILTMTYRPRTYDGRTTVWLADDHDEIEAWRGVLTGPAAIRRIGGDHRGVLREPLVAEVVAELRHELATVPGIDGRRV
ncbi:Thioesterase [Frankia casuarinae]|uniref:Thioesterase n=1 Tax=Frankia casuarinae (strain DSM 45818 / CECT 9043 / HFP020203 / CcI3) TaxID=106370 RepID=Q2JG40_FRACC|nr:Thioesterase [Frankia casuarinae]